MKQILILIFLLGSILNVFAVNSNQLVSQKVGVHYSDFHPEIMKMTIGDMLSMSARDYKRITGKRLGLKSAVKLKYAQRYFKKRMNKSSEDISSDLYVILAIVGLGWLAMGLLSDWNGEDWIINLILTALCWLPGVIHALVKKGDYF